MSAITPSWISVTADLDSYWDSKFLQLRVNGGQVGFYAGGLDVFGRSAAETGGDPGPISLVAGTGGLGLPGGYVLVSGGDGDPGGDVTITGGTSTLGSGGNASIKGGSPTGAIGTTYGMATLGTDVGPVIQASADASTLLPTLAFFATALVPQQTISGSQGGNTALASLIAALAAYGLIIDTTTP